MENIALIGIDLGKNSFHIHCQDRRGKAVYRKKFTRPKLIEFLATCPATVERRFFLHGFAEKFALKE